MTATLGETRLYEGIKAGLFGATNAVCRVEISANSKALSVEIYQYLENISEVVPGVDSVKMDIRSFSISTLADWRILNSVSTDERHAQASVTEHFKEVKNDWGFVVRPAKTVNTALYLELGADGNLTEANISSGFPRRFKCVELKPVSQ